jgi:hypothetical protein
VRLDEFGCTGSHFPSNVVADNRITNLARSDNAYAGGFGSLLNRDNSFGYNKTPTSTVDPAKIGA